MGGKKDKVLHLHKVLYHPGRQAGIKQFKMRLIANYARPIAHQSREGTEIQSVLEDQKYGKKIILMNSRNDFYQPGVVRSHHAPLLSS